MSIEEFEKDFAFYNSADNIEIESIFIRGSFDDFISHREFELASKNEYGKILGTFKDNDVYDFIYKDVYFDEDENYQINTIKLYEICEKCTNGKMYDEKNEVFYCPLCDDAINRLKDKIFKLLR